MAKLFYRLFILLYRLIIYIVAPFNKKARKAIKGRKRLSSKIEQCLSDNTSPLIWFHCASLGEFEQGRPIIERFRVEFPNHKVLLTFFSPSGYEVRKNYVGADYIFYLPWDTKKKAERFIDITRPVLAIFVKYEFWYHFISNLHVAQIPILSVSSIFRPKQIYFRSYGGFYSSILKKISHFFVQNRASKILLNKNNIDNVSVAGDTRFDRVAKIVSSKQDLPYVARFKGESKVMVIGSCWPEDLEVLMSFINESNLKFIIAPHEIDGRCQKIIQHECLRKTLLYSNIEGMSGEEQVLIIDNIGLLSSLYGYGDYAYIGGAFGSGLHNILEAAAFGIPVFFGNKNYTKFNEAVDLINLGGAVAIGDETQLRQEFRRFDDQNTLQIAGQVNRDYVFDNTGATEKVVAYCKNILTS